MIKIGILKSEQYSKDKNKLRISIGNKVYFVFYYRFESHLRWFLTGAKDFFISIPIGLFLGFKSSLIGLYNAFNAFVPIICYHDIKENKNQRDGS